MQGKQHKFILWADHSTIIENKHVFIYLRNKSLVFARHCVWGTGYLVRSKYTDMLSHAHTTQPLLIMKVIKILTVLDIYINMKHLLLG